MMDGIKNEQQSKGVDMPFKHKEDKAAYFKEWRASNPNAGKERMGKWCENNPEKRLFRGAKARAKKRGQEFNIVLGDIIIPTYCPYLGVKLDYYSPREEGNKYVASLDRIDSTKGYTPDNIEVISWLANMMKSSSSIEELQIFAKSVLLRFPICEE